MSEAAKRRWSFSLRTLFVLVALVAYLLGWNLYQVRTREEMRQSLIEQGGYCYDDPAARSTPPTRGLPIGWSLLGAKPVGQIIIPEKLYTEAEARTFEQYVPEAEVVQAIREHSLDGKF